MDGEASLDPLWTELEWLALGRVGGPLDLVRCETSLRKGRRWTAVDLGGCPVLQVVSALPHLLWCFSWDASRIVGTCECGGGWTDREEASYQMSVLDLVEPT